MLRHSKQLPPHDQCAKRPRRGTADYCSSAALSQHGHRTVTANRASSKWIARQRRGETASPVSRSTSCGARPQRRQHRLGPGVAAPRRRAAQNARRDQRPTATEDRFQSDPSPTRRICGRGSTTLDRRQALTSGFSAPSESPEGRSRRPPRAEQPKAFRRASEPVP